MVEEQGGIVGALAKALQSRSAQIQGSGKAIPKKMSVWIAAWEFLDPGGREGVLFFYIFFKLNLSNIGKKKNKIKISIEEVLYVVANKILSAGYFNEAGVDSKQTTILLWPKFSNEYLLC